MLQRAVFEVRTHNITKKQVVFFRLLQSLEKVVVAVIIYLFEFYQDAYADIQLSRLVFYLITL